MTEDTIALRGLMEKSADTDFLREMIGFAAQRLMELEVGGLTGAAHGEKSPDRLAQRNGYRERDWETRAGTVELRIPKLRTGSYQSLLLQETPRAPMGLFDPFAVTDSVGHDAHGGLVRLCSYCHAVGWPIGDECPEWIEPVDYYRRGGSDDVRVSHGICPSCFQRIVAPTLVMAGEEAGPGSADEGAP
jgi:hypothetical protein